MTTFRIHPALGIARVGNSPEYVIAPETMAGQPDPNSPEVMGGLPIRAGSEHDLVTSGDLRDKEGGLKRHAARFRIFAYEDVETETWPRGDGVEVRVGGQVDGKTVTDIIWTVHVANKKTNCFVLVEDGPIQGIDSFSDGRLPPIRNVSLLNAEQPQPPVEQRIGVLNDPARVAQLTIDPGPRTISSRAGGIVAFDRQTPPSVYDAVKRRSVTLPNYPVTFPAFPDMEMPSGPIDTLGELKIDPVGRLLVLGGYGRAAGWKIDGRVSVSDDVNNDQWFDDTSDGPVSATLLFDDGSALDAVGAWVTTTDPSFAPQILNMVSAWDDIYDCWVRKLDLAPQIFDGNSNAYVQDYRPTFDDQIAPIFRSAALQQWVVNLSPHGATAHARLAAITATDDPHQSELAGIYPIFRNPFKMDNPESPQHTNTTMMPLSLGDGFEAFLSLRKTQYFFLTRWNDGLASFRQGAGNALGPGEYLDKATLVNCLGGRFSPGIDVTFVVREPAIYVQPWQTAGTGPFRIKWKALDYAQTLRRDQPLLGVGYVPRHREEDGLEPGDLGKFMAIPWHADYNSCATHPPYPNPPGNRKVFWSWPAQRPVAVSLAADVRWIPNQPAGEEKTHLVPMLGKQRWSVRGYGTDSPDAEKWGRYQERMHMLDNWYRVGVVLQATRIDDAALRKEGGTVPQDWFLETRGLLRDTGRTPVVPFPNIASYLEQKSERDPGELDPRSLFHQLLNLSSYTGVLDDARIFVDYWLAQAEAISNDPEQAEHDNSHHVEFFPYSEQAFTDRLDLIYQELADAADKSRPGDPENVVQSRADAVERIKQLAPFNLLDGAWLRNTGRAGPQDEVRALLFSVWMDELGDGDVSMHHCNIYRDLCHSVGYAPLPINSREFAFDPTFLDTAFQVPAFQLAISQFTDDYLPEIIGMTLRLEWCVLDLKPIRDLMEFFDIDPHFYVMHIGIDNPVNGHGQRAAETVRLYLGEVREAGGEAAVQQAWRRIWNGYVAFLSVGTFFEDFAGYLRKRPTLRDRVITMISDKAAFGSRNHQRYMLGPTRLNEWFEDPAGFLDALAQHGYLTPGDWQNSRMRGLLDFQTGPMYRVFTDDEIALWEQYTNSLGRPAPTPPAPKPPAPKPPGQQMADLVDALRGDQRGSLGHQQAVLPDEKGVAHSIAWWFDQPTIDFLRALASPGNGYVTPGHPESSRLFTELARPTGPMGPVFTQPAPGGAGETCRDVLFRWIEQGCPVPSIVPASLGADVVVGERKLHRRRRMRGMGMTH
jgi:hypothetical protein